MLQQLSSHYSKYEFTLNPLASRACEVLKTDVAARIQQPTDD